MEVILQDFLQNKINMEQLKEICGNDLYNIKVQKAKKVFAKDIINLLNKYISHKITLQDVVNWVNVVWFTDLYEYNPHEENSIASVLTELETLDEEGVEFSEKDLLRMIECLKNNMEYM